MRLTIARFAMGLVMLGWGACGRTDLDLPQAEQEGAGAGGNGGQGSGSAEGGARSTASSGAFAGSGGASFSSSMPPKGGLPSTGGAVAGGAVATSSPASGGRSVVGGSFMSSSTAGRPMVGGTSNVGGSYRTGGTTAGGRTGGSVTAGRTGGTGGSWTGGRGGSSGRGGSTVGGRTGSTVVSTGGRSSPLYLESNEVLIDDLNDGDRFIAKLEGRVGSWKTSNDGTPGGTMFPDPNTPFVPTDTGDPNAKYAVYVKGSGFTSQGSYVSLGLGAPYDASKYTGIAFWAKSDAGRTYARVLFPDKDTDLDAGLCKTSGPAADMCYDHYGYRFSFDPGWNKYRIRFADLTQDGWGRKGTSFDPSTIFEIIFQFPANSTYAVWIDNLAFTL